MNKELDVNLLLQNEVNNVVPKRPNTQQKERWIARGTIFMVTSKYAEQEV